jgi:hypothetical protein
MTAAKVLGGCPGVGFLQDGEDLLLGELLPLHALSSLEPSVDPRRTLFQSGSKSGGGRSNVIFMFNARADPTPCNQDTFPLCFRPDLNLSIKFLRFLYLFK